MAYMDYSKIVYACVFHSLQEIKDTLDKEAIYRCMTTCYELSQVGESNAIFCQSFKLRND